jgi:hypothetical protein
MNNIQLKEQVRKDNGNKPTYSWLYIYILGCN